MPSVITPFRRHLPVSAIRLFHASHRFISTATGRNPAVASRDTIPSPSGCSRIERCGGETMSGLPLFRRAVASHFKDQPDDSVSLFYRSVSSLLHRLCADPIRACVPGHGFIIIREGVTPREIPQKRRAVLSMKQRDKTGFVLLSLAFLISLSWFPPLVFTLQAEEKAPGPCLPHSRKVFVSVLPLASCGGCEVIANLSTPPLPTLAEVFRKLAEKGRAVGADAVFDAKRKIEVSGGHPSYVGFGIAVRIANPAAVDFSEGNGRWL